MMSASLLAGWLPLFLAVLVLLGLGLAAMALGVMLRRPSLRGSCGGPAVHAADGGKISCASCPNREKHAHDRSACTHGH